MRFGMPVFFPVLPSGLAAILRLLDSLGGNYQLAGLNFPQLEQTGGSYPNYQY